ncbi:uncharacterized protein ACMZJ9_006750 [Mantella aurantiaca]
MALLSRGVPVWSEQHHLCHKGTWKPRVEEEDIQVEHILPRILFVCGLLVSSSQFAWSCPSNCNCFNEVKVFCSGDEIVQIPMDIPTNVSELVFLETSMYTLTSSSFTIYSQLRKIIFVSNFIDNINANAFHGLLYLTDLEISANPLSELEPGMLSELTELRKLTITHNAIETLPCGFFDKTTQLEILALQGNNISHICAPMFNQLVNLQELNIGSNEISDLSMDLFKPLVNLRILHLNNNHISQISQGTFDMLTNLTEITLNGNRLSKIYGFFFEHLTSLKKLTLSSNSITYISFKAFSTLHNLIWLTVERNQIESLFSGIFDGLQNLTHLSLSGNKLKVIPERIFSSLDKLQTLVLSKNQIEELQNTDFIGLESLTHLYLDHNHLHIIDKNTFKNVTNITFINLQNNRLTVLPEGIFDGLQDLIYLNLQNNPWQCNCLLTPFRNWIIENQDLTQLSDIMCDGPEHLQGKLVKLVKMRELNCTEPRNILQNPSFKSMELVDTKFSVTEEPVIDCKGHYSINGSRIHIFCTVLTCKDFDVKVSVGNISKTITQSDINTKGEVLCPANLDFTITTV